MRIYNEISVTFLNEFATYLLDKAICFMLL